MAHSVTKSGPYFEGTGEIKFSELRSTFKGKSSGEIRASEFLRKTTRTLPGTITYQDEYGETVTRESAHKFVPILPDCTENSAVAESTDWKTSQIRGTIKDYTITQTGSDQDLNGVSLDWNDNLTKNIIKTIIDITPITIL